MTYTKMNQSQLVKRYTQYVKIDVYCNYRIVPKFSDR